MKSVPSIPSLVEYDTLRKILLTEVEGYFLNLLFFNHFLNYLEKLVWELWTP